MKINNYNYSLKKKGQLKPIFPNLTKSVKKKKVRLRSVFESGKRPITPWLQNHRLHKRKKDKTRLRYHPGCPAKIRIISLPDSSAQRNKDKYHHSLLKAYLFLLASK